MAQEYTGCLYTPLFHSDTVVSEVLGVKKKHRGKIHKTLPNSIWLEPQPWSDGVVGHKKVGICTFEKCFTLNGKNGISWISKEKYNI